MKIKNLVVFFAFTCASTLVALDDYRVRISVIPVQNATGNDSFNSVCQTATDTVDLVLRLLGAYTVIDSASLTGVDLTDLEELEALATVAEKYRLDEIVFGTARSDSDGNLTFQLKLYNRADGKVKYSTEAVAESIFDVFDAADQITVGLISQMSDIHIGFGGVEIDRTGGTGVYTVYLNEERIRNPEKMLAKILNGSYTLSIKQSRLLGESEIYSSAIEIFEDKTTKVSFSIPPATEEEIAYFQSQREKLEEAATTTNDIENLLGEIARFQRITANIDYDATMVNKSGSVLDEAGTRAVELLESLMIEADQEYYARRPDFDGALESYGRISRLINDIYDFNILDDAGGVELSNPQFLARRASLITCNN